MIDNVVLIVTGTLHERDVQELLEKCHPLGMFDRYALSVLSIFGVNMLRSQVSFLQHCNTCSCTKYAGTLQIGSC